MFDVEEKREVCDLVIILIIQSTMLHTCLCLCYFSDTFVFFSVLFYVINVNDFSPVYWRRIFLFLNSFMQWWQPYKILLLEIGCASKCIMKFYWCSYDVWGLNLSWFNYIINFCFCCMCACVDVVYIIKERLFILYKTKAQFL